MSYSIRDLEHISGIKAHTLRIWEQRYNILEPKRTDTNIRLYDEADLKTVLNISVLNEHGFKISKIAGMSAQLIHDEVIAITERATRCCDRMQALTAAMLELDEDRFEKVLSNNIMNCGLKGTMLSIVFPLLQRVSALWQTGTVNRVHSNFINQLVRRRLIVVTDAQAEIHQRPDAKKFILILPEGETSELALLFADYLVRSQGHRSLYLGAGLPGPDLHTACRNYKPDFVICTLSGLPLTPEAYKSLEAIHAAFPEAHTLATGFKLCGCLPLPAENFSLLENFDMLGELLELGGAQ